MTNWSIRINGTHVQQAISLQIEHDTELNLDPTQPVGSYKYILAPTELSISIKSLRSLGQKILDSLNPVEIAYYCGRDMIVYKDMLCTDYSIPGIQPHTAYFRQVAKAPSPTKKEIEKMINEPNHMRIWRFQDAPEELRNLSTNGGDEDWLALIPPKLNDGFLPSWMDEGSSFGCCCVETHEHPELPGYKVCIGCHA